MPASFNDHQKVVEMLIRAGANVNVQDEVCQITLPLVLSMRVLVLHRVESLHFN